MIEADPSLVDIDPLVDPSLPKMNDYLHQFSEEELDAVADTVIDMVAFGFRYMKNEKGLPLVVEWHQLLWLAHLELHPWTLVEGPRGHGKSTIFTLWMLYKVTHDPTYRFLIASHIEELADEFSMRVMSYLEPVEDEPPIGEPYIPRDFQLSKGKQWKLGKAYFQGMRYPWVKTVAAKAGMTGGRFDAAVFDDPFTKLSIDSEKMRRKFKSWTEAAVIPAIDETDKHKIVVIGTKKHLDDWYTDLEKSGEFACHIDQLYSYDEEGNKVYLWPADVIPIKDAAGKVVSWAAKDHGFNEEREGRKRRVMDPQTFAMEMMNKAVTAEGLLFKYEWIQPHFYEDWREEVPERFREFYIGIDPSLGGQDRDTSQFALVVVCFDTRQLGGKIYIVDIVREWIDLGSQEKIIMQKYNEWNRDNRVMGVNMEGDLVNKDFTNRMMARLPIINRITYGYKQKSTGLRGTSSIDKKKRIMQVFGMLCMEGKIRFKNPELCRDTRDFLNYEYLQFPEGSLDGMDAINMAVDLVDFRREVRRVPLSWLDE
jgi:hypothetical protein